MARWSTADGRPPSPSPSQRAALHAATLRRRSNRRSQTPGPGAYETPWGISTKGGAGSAFKSASRRDARDEDYLGDPGAYDPYGANEMGNRSARSYSRSSCAGAGSFGSLSARTLQMQAAAVDTPGPGSYAQQAGLFDRARTGSPSSAFRSASSQRMKDAAAGLPGPASYEPKMSAIEPSYGSSVSTMRSKAERFKKDHGTTEGHVGPGSYETNNRDSVEQHVADAVLRASRSGAAFGSSAAQHRLAVEERGPGPGSYELERPRSSGPQRPTSAFKSASKRYAAPDESGDPGAYDPYGANAMGSRSARSYSRSSCAGAGSFGSLSARTLQMQAAAVDTPGPGSYATVSKHELGKGSTSKGPSSAFRSASSQRMKDAAAGLPGPASYEPKMSAIEPSYGSSVSTMRSKAERFKKDHGTTEGHVGPGSHEVTYDARGRRVSVGLTDVEKRVQSPAFISDSVRDLTY